MVGGNTLLSVIYLTVKVPENKLQKTATLLAQWLSIKVEYPKIKDR
jgi:hypothetical protein